METGTVEWCGKEWPYSALRANAGAALAGMVRELQDFEGRVGWLHRPDLKRAAWLLAWPAMCVGCAVGSRFEVMEIPVVSSRLHGP